MNSPAKPSFLAEVPLAPGDPILGVTEAYNADKNPKKVNLGVGVYYDEDGKVPLLDCVRDAERKLESAPAPHTYLPGDGYAEYNRAVRNLVFGADSAAVTQGRVVTVQALGGTGGLRIGADFLKRFAPGAKVYISDPSWENHRGLFEAAGFTVDTYAYYDAATHGVAFDRMMADVERMPAGSIIVLHACCHNPTGVDLSREQWTQVLDAVTRRGLIPFLDIAYQGFGDGIDADGEIVRRFADSGLPVIVANSFSKSFSLYGERIGALSVVTTSKDEATRVLGQLKRVVRTNYSNPASFGSKLVATVLNSPDGRTAWDAELAYMRDRIKSLRRQLVEKLKARLPDADFDFVIEQRGMFSYSGLTAEQVKRLREEFSIYAIDTGRICVAALNTKNLDYVADAIATVLKK
jgi:aromatic-amino-acid transaminase